jgi:hypothetical protein
MVSKSCYSLVRGVVGMAWVLLMIAGSLGCSVQASDSVSEEEAAMGAEFGRIYVKTGAALYTLEIDDAHPTGHLVHSRTVEKGGFVALIGRSSGSVLQGECTLFAHGLAAIELTTDVRSPTFFVDPTQFVGLELMGNDPQGIGIRTESTLSTANFDNCGSVLSSSASVTGTALLRSVINDQGQTLPFHLNVTTSEQLQLVSATDQLEALDICVPNQVTDSGLGQIASALPGLLAALLPKHESDDECKLNNQNGHFVRVTRQDAEQLIDSPEYAELESHVPLVASFTDVAPTSGSNRVAALAIFAAAIVTAIGAVTVLPDFLSPDLPAPVVLLSKALTTTIPEAGAQAHTDLIQDGKQNFRHICAAYCADDVGAHSLPQGLSFHAARDTAGSITTHLSTQSQGQRVDIAFGTGAFAQSAQTNAIKNLQTFRASKPAPPCIQPQIAFCINH